MHWANDNNNTQVRPVSYGEYQGFVPNRAEQKKLQDDLLENSNVSKFIQLSGDLGTDLHEHNT